MLEERLRLRDTARIGMLNHPELLDAQPLPIFYVLTYRASIPRQEAVIRQQLAMETAITNKHGSEPNR